ncbi:MAG: AraC family transcriptional regulator [Bacteroidota bacterium]
MKRIALPDELNFSHSNSVALFLYRSTTEIARQQIILNKNTFSFLAEGSKEVFFDNSSYAIENDQFLLMKSGHCLMTEKLSNTNRNYASILLFFSNELALKFIRKYDIPKAYPKDTKSVFSFKYDSFIKKFVNSLSDIDLLPNRSKNHLLEIKFEEIMLYLSEIGYGACIRALVDQNNDQRQKFTKTIESNQLNKLTIQELAFLSNMSVSTFKREFAKKYKESPMKWFQNKRLEHAYRLMRDEQKRPSDIFFEVGYENLSSFVQAYKAKYGVTPKQHTST